MNKQLLITFTPADDYFFGGENTFDAEVSGVRNYLVRSNKLPQQTTIVGVLRHILLKNNFDIGQGSFDPNYSGTSPQQYGKLHEVSPLFIAFREGATERFYWPASKLWIKDSKAAMIVDFDRSPGRGMTGTLPAAIPALYWEDQENVRHQYNSKHASSDCWLPVDGSEAKASSDIFKSSLHIGIDKASRMRDEMAEEAFYKQEFYQLEKGYAFAILATVDGEVPEQIFDTVMQMGGEQRSFSIQAVALSGNLTGQTDASAVYPSSTDERITLLSDAWVEDTGALMQFCRFAMTDTIPFRNIKTSLNPTANELANLHHGKSRQVRNLLRRGSVLFPLPGKRKDVCALLDHKNFQTIGYNHYL